MMEYYIQKIFEDELLVGRLSNNLRKTSLKFNNRKDITEKMINIYEQIKDKNNL